MSRSETDMKSSMGRIHTLLTQSSATTVTTAAETNKTTVQRVISDASTTQAPKTSLVNPAVAAISNLPGEHVNKADAITTDSTHKPVNPGGVATRQSTGTPPPQDSQTISSFYIGTPADLHKLRTVDDFNRSHGGNTDSAVNSKKIVSNPKRRTMGF